MDDDGAHRPLARRAVVLVVPAPVVKAPLAGEEIRIPVRIVVHDHEDLAGEVHALEVVPLEFVYFVPLPPRYVAYPSAVPVGFSFATKAFV